MISFTVSNTINFDSIDGDLFSDPTTEFTSAYAIKPWSFDVVFENANDDLEIVETFFTGNTQQTIISKTSNTEYNVLSTEANPFNEFFRFRMKNGTYENFNNADSATQANTASIIKWSYPGVKNITIEYEVTANTRNITSNTYFEQSLTISQYLYYSWQTSLSEFEIFVETGDF